MRQLFGQIDQNHDGRIDFGEFCDYIFDQPDKQKVPNSVKAGVLYIKGA